MHKIEIIIDRAHLSGLTDLFRAHDLRGYTVLDIREGTGALQGLTPTLGPAGASEVLVFVVGDANHLAPLLSPLSALVRRCKGFALVLPVVAILT